MSSIGHPRRRWSSSMTLWRADSGLARTRWEKSLQIDKKDYQIVGVVEAGRYIHLHETVQPYLFLPFTQVFSFECGCLWKRLATRARCSPQS